MSAKGKSLGARSGVSYAERASARWNGRPPDWVCALAAEADRARAAGQSQGDLGERLGISGSVISAVIGKTYPGRYDVAEAKVRGHLMSATVVCPVEETIGLDRCAANQALKFSAANPSRAKFPFVCRSCPNRIEASK
ncbi:MAG: transcriptional regulator [Rhizomicrobium sp.]